MKEFLIQGSANSQAPEDSDMRHHFKEILTQVLLDSGLLQDIVETVVERKMQAFLSADRLSEVLRREATNLAKGFLQDNLGKILKKDIETAIEQSAKLALASENVKILIDDKFRAVSLYLQTDVIPKAVRQALSESPQAVS